MKSKKYEPVKRDFVKVDRKIIDVVIPFLNQHASIGYQLYLDLLNDLWIWKMLQNNNEMISERMAYPKEPLWNRKC